MPTFDVSDQFWNEWDRLHLSRQERFLKARDEFVACLKKKRPFPAHLDIHPLKSQKGVFIFCFGPDNRALFRYGDEQAPGDAHILWLRIGGHEVEGR